MPPSRGLPLTVRGQSLPWPLSTWSTAGNAEGCLGRRSPHRAAADWFHSLLNLLIVAVALPAAAADAPPASPGPELAAREAALARQYRDLERSFLRLADLLDASDPRRAAVLRAACDRARGDQVADRLDTIVRLLEAGQLLKAGTSQDDALGQLRALLDMLAAGGDGRRRSDERREIRSYLARLGKAIGQQRELQGAAATDQPPPDLGARQATLADDAQRLADDLGAYADRAAAAAGPAAAAEKDPADGADRAAESADSPEPEGDDDDARARRSQRRLEAAEARMRRARERLEAADANGDARAEQDRALEELENARAELERILRQMREQEVEQLLVQLEARVRDMLAAETGIRAALDRLPTAAPAGDRQRELEAARLGREQQGVAVAAGRALQLVREDGSAVAVPQALEQVRDDAEQAAARLARDDTGDTTRGLVADLVTGLEELLAAVEKSRRDQAGRTAGAAAGAAGAAGEQPLVDALAELRMLRSLQVRVNGRTRRFAGLLGADGDRADEPELRAALARLAERQRLIERAARDIVGGRTE
jgi:hypothetical protein